MKTVFFLQFFVLQEICNPGYYCPAGSVRPVPCPWGTYQPKKGQSSALACKQCPDFDKLKKSDPSQKPPARNITDCPSAEYQPTGLVKEGIKKYYIVCNKSYWQTIQELL